MMILSFKLFGWRLQQVRREIELQEEQEEQQLEALLDLTWEVHSW